ncbi:hypothetical protein EXS71_04625 [Candidatus Uhrbacteria bacterium]|nr:hypothetical protein [Candidatus Uhrbacteria bacterium]
MENLSPQIVHPQTTPLPGSVSGRSKIWLGVLISAALFLIALYGGWRALNQPFRIPTNTHLLISVSPRMALRFLPTEWKQELPNVWRNALETHTSFPILLGAYEQDSSWHFFALLPRWETPTPPPSVMVKHGLAMLIADQPFLTDKMSARYTDAWRMALAHPLSRFSAHVDLTPWGFDPFEAFGSEHVINTTIPFAGMTSPYPLKQSDISLTIPDRAEERTLVERLLREIHVGHWLFADLPDQPTQINIVLDKNFKPLQSEFLFKDLLSPEEIKLLLAQLGLTKRRIIELPDQTLVTEERLQDLSINSSAMIELPPASGYSHLEIQPRGFRLGTLDIPINPRQSSFCPKGAVSLAYFSTKFSTFFFHALNPSLKNIPAIELANHKGKLVFCY